MSRVVNQQEIQALAHLAQEVGLLEFLKSFATITEAFDLPEELKLSIVAKIMNIINTIKQETEKTVDLVKI